MNLSLQGGDNTPAAILNEPTPLLSKQCLDQLGKAKTKFDHANQLMNITHPTLSDGGHTVQPTALQPR